MSFLTEGFFFFFPLVVFGYFSIPQRFRWLWLLAASYLFYASWDPRYCLFLILITLITYFAGLQIGTGGFQKISHKKAWVAVGFVFCLGILSVFKYLNFFSEIWSWILSLFGSFSSPKEFSLILPVGISFYTLQALTYLVDVYRGDIGPERHLGKYALFVSFFPQLLSGPIGKAKDMLPQFSEKHVFDYDRARAGLLTMLWGYFQKVVVADRLGKLVDTVFAAPDKYHGPEAVVAALFFAFQLYCDFAGYSNIAIGAAQVLGFRLPVNFERPYFSKSIPEFWRRWHISLGSWFKDYLYFPLGGSRCSQFRHLLNIIIVFAVCGLWHGAAVNFVVWGLLHGIYQAVGILTRPAKRKAMNRLSIRNSSRWLKLYRVAVTFVLTDFAWIFFRAKTFAGALALIRNLFVFRPSALWDGSLYQLGLKAPEFWAAVAGILVVLAVDLLARNRDLREVLLAKRAPCRWAVYLTAALVLVFFGVYGTQYSAQTFIYDHF